MPCAVGDGSCLVCGLQLGNHVGDQCHQLACICQECFQHFPPVDSCTCEEPPDCFCACLPACFVCVISTIAQLPMYSLCFTIGMLSTSVLGSAEGVGSPILLLGGKILSASRTSSTLLFLFLAEYLLWRCWCWLPRKV